MRNIFICYPRCTTCRKAKKWLDDNGIGYEERNIKEHNPSEGELRTWVHKSDLPLKRFFNTSGQIYRSLGLSKKITHMSEDEKFALLASDGLLVKRPIMVLDNKVLVGFREEEWNSELI